MKQKRRSISRRRAFLGGSAAVIGLPFLESLLSRGARAQSEPAPRRLIYYFVPNGIHMPAFRPASTGTEFSMPPMLAPLTDLRADFNVVTGLENRNAIPTGGGDHAAGTAAFITCAKANKSETDIHLGISTDQIAANAIGAGTRLPSLQLGIDGGADSGNCDTGYSCAYARNISWAGPSTPLPKITSPRQAFELLFAGWDPQATQIERDKRQSYDTSVLDVVSAEAQALTTQLGRDDSAKLGEYLTGVRELERRITTTTELACAPGEPPASDMDFLGRMDAMTDLMVLAFQCDATRVLSFMLGNAGSSRTYSFLGINQGHHFTSHHLNNPAMQADLQTIGTWEVAQLAELMVRLKRTPDGPGGESNLLYNSTIFWSSSVSDGNRHNHDDMPILVAGHGGGALRPGQHIAYPTGDRQRVSNLLVSTLATVGVLQGVGDSTGRLEDVLS